MNRIKTLILAACLVAAPLAQADSWTMPNEAGGAVVLTDRPCPVKEAKPLLEAYTFSSDGLRAAGCWGIIDGLAHVWWQTGQRTVYPLGNFSPQGKQAPAKPASERKSLSL